MLQTFANVRSAVREHERSDEVGQQVTTGQTLVILESMKMQNELKAPRDAVVQAINVQPGQSVEQNKPLVKLG